VRCSLLLQGRYEYFMQYYAARPVFGALLAAGVQIHEYAPSFLHAKVAVIDGHWATVGSSNLDPLQPAAGARGQRGGRRPALRRRAARAAGARDAARGPAHGRRPPSSGGRRCSAPRNGWR
jgi:cardiolipin synthase